MLSMSVSLDGVRGRFAHWLARHRLIDEYRLTVPPAALGEGLPLFRGLPEPLRLVLASSTVYTDGSVDQVYTPA
jgi:dihydrofolate reductase